MQTISYQPKGVCSRHMEIDVEDGVIHSVRVIGGCSGNHQGISSRKSRVADICSETLRLRICKNG